MSGGAGMIEGRKKNNSDIGGGGAVFSFFPLSSRDRQDEMGKMSSGASSIFGGTMSRLKSAASFLDNGDKKKTKKQGRGRRTAGRKGGMMDEAKLTKLERTSEDGKRIEAVEDSAHLIEQRGYDGDASGSNVKERRDDDATKESRGGQVKNDRVMKSPEDYGLLYTDTGNSCPSAVSNLTVETSERNLRIWSTIADRPDATIVVDRYAIDDAAATTGEIDSDDDVVLAATMHREDDCAARHGGEFETTNVEREDPSLDWSAIVRGPAVDESPTAASDPPLAENECGDIAVPSYDIDDIEWTESNHLVLSTEVDGDVVAGDETKPGGADDGVAIAMCPCCQRMWTTARGEDVGPSEDAVERIDKDIVVVEEIDDDGAAHGSASRYSPTKASEKSTCDDCSASASSWEDSRPVRCFSVSPTSPTLSRLGDDDVESAGSDSSTITVTVVAYDTPTKKKGTMKFGTFPLGKSKIALHDMALSEEGAK
ncbi:hypothetical protein ACHAW5_005246 [Stephanodiscus triporus]|uniref:Uncharacterized protein n=1 Tax=Stephanodiscus triporus TaxID=2934178 RepID=A0ABD3MS72_9STRA